MSLGVLASGAQAAGFAILEQSGRALGSAFAGRTAGAEDISYMFFNPAGLTRHSGTQALVIGSYIAPRFEIEAGRASTVAPLSVPITGGRGGGDAANNAVVPAAYGMWEVNPRLRVGLGLTVPFALQTDYEDGWIGRYHALRSEILSFDVNPVVAYRITDRLSLGAGLSIQYVRAELSNAIDFGTIGFASGIPGAVPTQQDGRVELEGDDVSLGFNAGILFEPWPGTRFGVSYRSKINHTLEGDANFTLDRSGVGSALAAATGRFVSTAAKADFTSPDTLAVGFHHDINDRWSVMADAAWTNWVRFDELRVRFANPAQPADVVEQDWTGSWFVAGGVAHRPTEAWTLRAGVAHDRTPMSDERRTPRIPGSDRTWISIGASYQPFDRLSFSAGYAHLFVSDASIDLKATSLGSTFRGNLSADGDNSVDIFALQALVVF